MSHSLVPTSAAAGPPALAKISAEQTSVLDHIALGNVIVASVAGSGKTTTILHAAIRFYDQNILLLTYNTKLRRETRAKITAYEINNLTVHTYHSFCADARIEGCGTDVGIERYLASTNITPKPYDIIAIDEAQDMKPLFYHLVVRIREGSPSARMVILGDRFQSVYGFMGADYRFLTMADELYTTPSEQQLPWARVTLTTSYRVTHQLAKFINEATMGYQHMSSSRQVAVNPQSPGGPYIRPQYKYCSNALDQYKKLADHIKDLINTGGYRPDDIFVLANSVKDADKPITANGRRPKPIRYIGNALTALEVPIYVPPNDARELSEDLLDGKVAFSTFCQSKGLERKVVFVIGFDDAHTQHIDKVTPADTCPAAMHVAITRSSERLYLVHIVDNGHLPFLNVAAMTECCDVSGTIIDKPRHVRLNGAPRNLCVTSVIRHLPPDAMAYLMSLITVTQKQPAGESIRLEAKVPQTYYGRTLIEDVSDINGIAIPAFYEQRLTGHVRILDMMPDRQKMNTASIGGMLRAVVEYLCWRDGWYYRRAQITQYNWLTNRQVNACVERMKRMISGDQQMEVGYVLNSPDIAIGGSVDVLSDGRILWEIKCTSSITEEHMLQTAMYALMHQLETNTVGEYFVYNVRTDECVQITASLDNLCELARAIVHYKYNPGITTTDDEFREQIIGSSYLGRRALVWLLKSKQTQDNYQCAWQAIYHTCATRHS